MRYSSIDIGTNSLILLVLDLGAGERKIIDKPVITRLGEGLAETGFLSEIAMERTIRVLKEFKEILKRNDVMKTIPFGTWALREAKNAALFLRKVERETGFDVKVLSEKEEAFFNYLSVIEDPQLNYTDEVIVDIGGGSTEIITVENGKIDTLRSIPIGAVKLKEEVLKILPAKESDLAFAMDLCDGILVHSLPRKKGELLGIGGSVTNLCAMVLNRKAFDPHIIHGKKIMREEVERIFHEIKNLSASEILLRFPFLGKSRADIILAGTIVLHRLMKFFDSSYVKVSTKGVRYGIIYWMARESRLDGKDLPCYRSQ